MRLERAIGCRWATRRPPATTFQRATRTGWTAILGALVATGLLHAQSQQRAIAGLEELSDSFEALSEQVSPAVVQIVATGFAPLAGATDPQAAFYTRQQVGGSGVVLDPNGFIVTNAHVVDGAARIRVLLPLPYTDEAPGGSILKPAAKTVGARVVGVDRETDIAVLKVDEMGLPFLRLGDSDELRKGQLVFAFGSPRGLENSVTLGVISSVARQLKPEAPVVYVQTDAPINPGSSGGPLVDTRGQVMGISTFILSESGGSEGLGFAVPSNIVHNVFDQIRRTGFVVRGEIGVYAQTITPALAAGLGLSRDWGVVLGDVYPGSSADRAGLRIGDIVLSVNSKLMENGRQFNVTLYNLPPGQEVTLEVLRGSQPLTIRPLITERPDALVRLAPLVTAAENLVSRLGILALDIDSNTSAYLPPLRQADGVVVAAWSPGVSAGTELLPGDVIYALNGRPVTSLAGLQTIIDALPAGAPAVLQVERRGRLMFVSVDL